MVIVLCLVEMVDLCTAGLVSGRRSPREKAWSMVSPLLILFLATNLRTHPTVLIGQWCPPFSVWKPSPYLSVLKQSPCIRKSAEREGVGERERIERG